MEGISGEVFNIGPDNGEITVNQLAELCLSVKNIESLDSIKHIEDRPLEVKHAFCSSDKASKMLDFKPQGNLVGCLHKMSLGITPMDWDYDNFPIEIKDFNKMPRTWRERL